MTFWKLENVSNMLRGYDGSVFIFPKDLQYLNEHVNEVSPDIESVCQLDEYNVVRQFIGQGKTWLSVEVYRSAVDPLYNEIEMYFIDVFEIYFLATAFLEMAIENRVKVGRAIAEK
jgi:hypothetical protein